MTERFHPSAKATIAKIIGVAALLSGAILLLGAFLGPAVLLALVAVWGAAILLSLSARAMELFKTIEIGENSIRYSVGILSTQTMVVPYERISNIQTSQTFLQRLVGLGTVGIDTAGGDTIELVLTDIPQEQLQRVVEKLEEKTNQPVAKR